jgi:hypothetical protein
MKVKFLCITFGVMNIRKSLLCLLLACTTFWSACDNEIELNAPYKEIGVIYGIIYASTDTIHRIRIQKAFLGDGNANTMAQVPDSTYYPDILDVQLQRIQNGNVTSSIPLIRYVGPDKDDGIFPVAPNVLYRTNGEPIYRDSEYKLHVKNTVTGHEFYASTPIVDSSKITKPSRSPSSLISFSNPLYPYNVEFTSGRNAKVVHMTVRFHYGEEVIGSGVVEQKYIDWEFPDELIANPEVPEPVKIQIEGEEFYEFVGQKITANSNVVRYVGTLDFIFASGAEFLANYVSINEATTSILTSAPYYSNVVGGTGIFSSRYTQTVPNKQLDPPSKDLLLTSPYTSNLGFQ